MDEDAFREFVATGSAALVRNVYLLVGERTRAEDLVVLHGATGTPGPTTAAVCPAARAGTRN